MKLSKFLLFPLFSFILSSEDLYDSFGVKKFYPTKKGTLEWNSQHWNNSIPRDVDWEGDPYDPFGWTEDHSAGSTNPSFKIDGKGILQMMTSMPRFHINSIKGNITQFYKNIEFSAYFKRSNNTLDGKDNGGMVVGVRTGPLAHESAGGNLCDASCYYGRIRHDGKWDFEKEWKHPESYYQSEGVIGRQAPLWNGTLLPTDLWIGMKYIVYNPNKDSVKLIMYIDRTSNGTVEKAVWEKVGEALDEGKDWSGAGPNITKIEGCKEYNGLENAMDAILEGHGTVLMRTDTRHENQIQGEYKYVTIREIDPFGKFEDDPKKGGLSGGIIALIIILVILGIGISVFLINRKFNCIKIGTKIDDGLITK